MPQFRFSLLIQLALPSLHYRDDGLEQIYVHCNCGCDRTGEVAGAYYMRYLNMTYGAALALDDNLIHRGMACANQRALQYDFCLCVEGRGVWWVCVPVVGGVLPTRLLPFVLIHWLSPPPPFPRWYCYYLYYTYGRSDIDCEAAAPHNCIDEGPW